MKWLELRLNKNGNHLCVLILTMKWLELRLNKNGNHLLHARACPRKPTHCILMPAQDVRSPTLFWENTEGIEHAPRTRGVFTWRYCSHQVQPYVRCDACNQHLAHMRALLLLLLHSVSGLKGAPEHNGKEGTITRYDQSKGRFVISLIGEGKNVALKPSNLSPMEDRSSEVGYC